MGTPRHTSRAVRLTQLPAVLLAVLTLCAPRPGAAANALERQAGYDLPFANKGYRLLELLVEERIQLEEFCLTLDEHELDGLDALREKIKQLEDGLYDETVKVGRAEQNQARRKRYAEIAKTVEAVIAKEQQLQGGIDTLVTALKQKDMQSAGRLLSTADAYFGAIMTEWHRLVQSAAGEISHKSIKDEYNALRHAHELVLVAARVESYVLRFRRTSGTESRKAALDLLANGEKHIEKAGEEFREGRRRREEERSGHEDVLEALDDLKNEWEDAAKVVKHYLNLTDRRKRASADELRRLDAAIRTLQEESRGFADEAEKLVFDALKP